MSHFTCLVIGDDIDEQMAPFHEFECTGDNNEYVLDIDKTEEYRNDFKEYGKPEQSFLDFVESWTEYEIINQDEEPDTDNAHKYGYIIVDENGEFVKAIKRTNPNKKWDGYQPFKKILLKDGRVVESARKKDIDFQKMRENSIAKAKAKWDHAMTFLGGLPPNQPWKTVQKGFGNIDEAQAAYWKQERCQAYKNNVDYSNKILDSFYGSPDDFLMTEEGYLEKAANESFCSFAFLKDRKWYERGRMGWFAMVSNEKDDWDEILKNLIDNVGEDEMMSFVDCHV